MITNMLQFADVWVVVAAITVVLAVILVGALLADLIGWLFQ